MEILRNIHDQLLEAIGAAHSQLRKQALTTFFPMKGHLATGELMVIGRAVNGWASAWMPNEIADPNRRAEVLDEVFQRSTTTEKCPLEWVCKAWGRNEKEKYNTKRSAFWKVIHAVTRNLNIANYRESYWASHLIWSDLYKIAPHGGGNPSPILKRVQETDCRTHLKQETAHWKPQRILFLTGHNWCRAFLQEIGTLDEIRSTPNQLAQWCGTVTLASCEHTASVVVAVHPQGYRHSQVVREVLDCFSLIPRKK